MESTIEKASNLATEALTKINAPAVEKAAVEATEAAAAKEKSDAETKKIEGQKLAEAEVKAQKDEEILNADDSKLSAEDKTRKTELLDIKTKKDNTPEEKIKRTHEASQKRIDEMKSELLEKQSLSDRKIAQLEAELAETKKVIQPKIEEDAKAKSKREESERFSKYIEEDKSKSREERREMSKESLEEWYLEDPLAATEWIQERTVRRSEERKELAVKDDSKRLADEFISNQNKSRDKLFAKYPGVNPSKEKIAQLKTVEALSADNEEFRICSEIVAADPKKYLESVDGPELLMVEMEKRLAKPVAKSKVEMTEEEIEAKIQAEVERRSKLDIGISSNGGKKVENKETQKSDFRQKQEAIAKKAGISVEQLEQSVARRKTIGVGAFDRDE